MSGVQLAPNLSEPDEPAPSECICGPSALRVGTLSDCPIHGEPAPEQGSPE